jgi:acetyl esterase/lipase
MGIVVDYHKNHINHLPEASTMKKTTGTTAKGTTYTLTADLPYVPNAQARQDLDVYIPDRAKPEGGWLTVVYAHGGGFVAGDKADKGLGFDYALRALDYGFAMVSINYRLPGRDQVELEIKDTQAAVRYLASEAASLGLNGNRIALMGASAGAALVASAAARAKAEGEPNAIAVVGICGGFNVTKTADELHSECPPFYIVHGTADSIVNISVADELCAKLDKVGVSYVYERIEGADHSRPIDKPNLHERLIELGKQDDVYIWLGGIIHTGRCNS